MENSVPPVAGPSSKNFFVQIEDFLNQYLVTKAPFQLPEGFKNFLVSATPWIILIILVLSLPALFFALGLGTILLPFAVFVGFSNSLQVLIAAAAFILGIIALPGLFKHTKQGWNFLFYSELVTCLGYLIALRLVTLIIFGLITFYLIFQIRSFYR